METFGCVWGGGGGGAVARKHLGVQPHKVPDHRQSIWETKLGHGEDDG